MQKSVTGMSINKGFTLIELLIVIVIIGITTSLALIAFGDFGQSKRLIFAVEQLENTLKLAQQQAILEHSTLGLQVNNQSYQLLKFSSSGTWNPISNKNLFKIHYFPENTLVNLEVNNKKELKDSPVIIITPGAELTPFIMNFGTLAQPNQFTLQGSHNGYLTLVKH